MDEPLRALERAVEADGGPRPRLAYAQALLRAGREVDAVAALWPAVDDPDVTAFLAALPGYDGIVAGACWRGFGDVAPCASAPRSAWRADVDASAGLIAASPLAVVVRGAADVTVLDPRDGRALGRHAVAPDFQCALVGDVLVREAQPWLVGCAARTGAELWRSELRRDRLRRPDVWDPEFHWIAAPGRLVVVSDERVRALPWRDPRRAPAKRARWTFRCLDPDVRDMGRESPMPHVLVTRDRVWINEANPRGVRITLLDADAGRIIARHETRPEPMLADDHGAVGCDSSGGRYAFFGPTGERRSEGDPGGAVPLVLTPTHAVFRVVVDAVEVVAREPGGRTARVPAGRLLCIAAARGVLYVAGQTQLTAYDLAGWRRWEVAHGAGGVPSLGVAAGRVYTADATGVTCWEG